MVVVILIGCLECGYESELLGAYDSTDAAKAAHPEMTMRSEMKWDDWHGSGVCVGFEVAA